MYHDSYDSDYIFHALMVQTSWFRESLIFFAVGKSFQKEFENYCFEDSKTQVSWGLEQSLFYIYKVAAVGVQKIQLLGFSYLQHEVP